MTLAAVSLHQRADFRIYRIAEFAFEDLPAEGLEILQPPAVPLVDSARQEFPAVDVPQRRPGRVYGGAQEIA